MKVGQFIYLKSDTTYAEIYDAPSISSSPLGFTAGYVGIVKTLNVAGVGESTTFIGITDAFNNTKYINNADSGLFDFNDTDPNATDTGSSGSGSGSSGGSSGDTFGKIASVLEGIFGVFKKSKTTSTNTGGSDSSGSSSGDGTDSNQSDPTTGNNSKSGFSVWFGNNWYWAVPLLLLIPGGIIWAISAIVKKSKSEKQLLNSNTTKPM